MIVKGNIFLRFYRRFGRIGHRLQCVPPTEEHGDVQLRTSCRSERSIYQSGLQYMVSNIFIIACVIPLRDNFILL